MKKLGKLSINPEKLLKDKELIEFKGGYVEPCCYCNDGTVHVITDDNNAYRDCTSICSSHGGQDYLDCFY